ncbi:MAG: glycosyltransferase family 4 protein [candidate division KSB1 bacterium]|nr:glycosyltransferase family 4 protein [candidate division KSB1 bacterium]MDZ7300906.1 glycosyltransferase family 4 protein [candidate division KSB1 bacterium]MDZ7314058.1 glycosyltransferase family 4 protein [candidate division KSB1 bacterium]
MTITYFNYVWDIAGISAGAAIKARQLLGAISKLGHTTHIEWRTPQPDGQINVATKVKEKLKPKLQKYLHEPKKVALNFPNLIKEYGILKKQKPDIFFNRLELYAFSGAWLSRWLNIPMVVEADCPPTYEHMTFYGKNYMHLGNLAAKLELQTLRQAEAVIAISNILKNYYVEQGIKAEKIHVIPNGADPHKFRPREKPSELVKKYALQDKVVIGWIGSLAGWAGIENLVAMALYVLENYPNTALMMVGGGANKEFFSRELGIDNYASRVILPGTIPHEEVPDYLACMDIVLAPYPQLPFWYPSSMKVFEYMSAGKAVIASAVGQICEVIKDGKNGVLFDPDSKDELLRKTIGLLENEEFRRNLGEQARREILRSYTWEQHAKTIVAIFEEILQRRKLRKQRNG